MRRAWPWLPLAFCLAACVANDDEPVPDVSPVPAAEPPSPDAPLTREAFMELDRQTAEAVSDLAARLDVDAGAIQVLEARAVTWADSSLGCPEPGAMYLQVLTPGIYIRLQAGDVDYPYHAARSGTPFLCPPGRSQAPLPERGAEVS
jgi:hypothetical protein